MQTAKADSSKNRTKPKTSELPFYALPRISKNSAEIINEARASIRTVNSKHTFISQKEGGRLFDSEVKLSPSSSFSLNEPHYESGDSRPVSAVRLQPLEQNPKIKLNFDRETASNTFALENNNSPRLPSIPIDRFSLDTYYSDQLPDNISPNSLQSQPVVTKLPADCVNAEDKTEINIEGNCLQIRKRSLKPNDLIQVTANQEADIYYKTKIIPLLDEYFRSRNVDENHFSDVTKQLYFTLEATNLLGKNCTDQPSVLKELYQLLVAKHQQLQLLLARIINSVEVKENNLSTFCKLIFKVAQSDINDQLPPEDNILEVVLEAVSKIDTIQDSKALVYGVSALKFLSKNSSFLKELSKLGCIDVITKRLSTINTQNENLNKLPKQISHLLLKVISCLRNLAKRSVNSQSFISSSVILIIISSLRVFLLEVDEIDVVISIARILMCRIIMYLLSSQLNGSAVEKQTPHDHPLGTQL